MTSPPPFRLLVICTGNRARSQMAHGWLCSLGSGRVEVWSAGTNPKGVHSSAVEVMGEDDFDLVVTVCESARESCPVFPGARRMIHCSFGDPDRPGIADGERIDVFRRVRDETGDFSRTLLETGVSGATTSAPGGGGEQ